MAAQTNSITSAEICTGLDIEFVQNFNGDFDRLSELLGLVSVDVMSAGQALYQFKVTGTLNATTPDEGDETPLSQYKVEKVPVGDLTPKRYGKQTTAEAIMKGGFENAVARTDRKMLGHLRKLIIDEFITFLASGTGTASGKGLQAAIAKADAVLGDAVEANDDQDGEIIHFVNRQDAADYLADATITTQNAYGMTYLQNFLGADNVFITNKVDAGTVYATTSENIHAYGIDFSTLGEAGLVYETSSNGTIGVHHEPDYNRGSADTWAMCGLTLVPENLGYIIKSSITKSA